MIRSQGMHKLTFTKRQAGLMVAMQSQTANLMAVLVVASLLTLCLVVALVVATRTTQPQSTGWSVQFYSDDTNPNRPEMGKI